MPRLSRNLYSKRVRHGRSRRRRLPPEAIFEKGQLAERLPQKLPREQGEKSWINKPADRDHDWHTLPRLEFAKLVIADRHDNHRHDERCEISRRYGSEIVDRP